jgi:hypothetical protein
MHQPVYDGGFELLEVPLRDEEVMTPSLLKAARQALKFQAYAFWTPMNTVAPQPV